MLFESVFYEFMQSFSGIALFSRDGDRFYKCIHWDSSFFDEVKGRGDCWVGRTYFISAAL